MEKLIPFTVHIMDGIFLAEPERVYLKCGYTGNRRDEIYRYLDPVGSFDPCATVCVEVEGGGTLPMVCNTNFIDVKAFTVTYKNRRLANKYFTEDLFRNYINSVCCNCDNDCDDTCYLISNGCTASTNNEGLLI